MTRSDRITLRDVAGAVGVSTTTVSDALSGRGRLPPATRERVAAVARDLGYMANPSARHLRAGRTGTIGLYLPARSLGYEYMMRMAMSAADAAMEHDLSLMLLPPRRAGSLVPVPQLDGVVVSDPVLADPFLIMLGRSGAPLVTCERDLTPGSRSSGRVESDHRAGLRGLLEHLVAGGAERVALITPGSDTAFGLDLNEAYRQWCADTGLRPILHEVPFACEPGDITAAVRRVLRARPRPTGLVVVPDGSAVIVLDTLVRAGVRVPDDLLLAGYVDSAPLATLSTPVTALDLSPAQMGRRAVRLLVELLAGRSSPGTVQRLPTHLVVRASTRRGNG